LLILCSRIRNDWVLLFLRLCRLRRGLLQSWGSLKSCLIVWEGAWRLIKHSESGLGPHWLLYGDLFLLLFLFFNFFFIIIVIITCTLFRGFHGFVRLRYWVESLRLSSWIGSLLIFNFGKPFFLFFFICICLW